MDILHFVFLLLWVGREQCARQPGEIKRFGMGLLHLVALWSPARFFNDMNDWQRDEIETTRLDGMGILITFIFDRKEACVMFSPSSVH